MIAIKRGDVYFIDLNHNQSHIQRGRRMYLVVSNNSGNWCSNIVTVVPLTTKRKPRLPTHAIIYVTLHNNQKVRNTVLCEQIQTIPKSDLKNFVCHLSVEKMKQVNQGLKSSLHLL